MAISSANGAIIIQLCYHHQEYITLVIMYWIDVLELLSEGQPLMFSVMDIEIDICMHESLFRNDYLYSVYC